MSLSGFLNIIKPPGMTSFAVVARVRALTGERHVGHGGTLDPDASGVLPVALGPATRLVEYLADSSKLYRAEIELGVSTDTYDASGKVVSRKDPSIIKREMAEEALTSFVGIIQQVPPMYSALRYKGRRLYKLAREGIEIERKARDVNVHHIELVDYHSPRITIDVECGKGTYIRCIASELGEKLSVGGYMKNLCRLRVGPFDITDGVSLTELEEACRYGFFERFVYPRDTVLQNLNAAIINFESESALRKGQQITLNIKPCLQNVDSLRTYSLDGRFIGLLSYDRETAGWQPDKIFN